MSLPMQINDYVKHLYKSGLDLIIMNDCKRSLQSFTTLDVCSRSNTFMGFKNPSKYLQKNTIEIVESLYKESS